MPNVTRGDRMGGLLSYLAGEGRRNEHTEPHLVNGDSATYTFYGDAELDRATALAIARDLDEPRTAFGVEVAGGHVWHCSLSLRAVEGQLSDEQWSAIAQQFVDRMGFTEASGKAQCRWVAVRHGLSARGNDHIHVAVNLIREDGTKASIHHDYSRAQKVARELEQEHGLQVLESRGSDMALRGERPGERASAERRGEQTVASVRLERTVRAAAAASTDEAEFVRRLHQSGAIARPRFAADRDDVVAGYSVALRPKPGEPIVWYGGGRLARDLTLPRLRQGWPDTPASAQAAVDEWRATWRNPLRYTPVAPGREQHEPGPDLWREYTDDVAALREQLRGVDPRDRATWAQAARETSGAFAAWSQRLETEPGPLADAARTLARTAQIRARDTAPRGTHALRSIAGVASLMAMASTGGRGTMAEAMLFRQLMRTAQAIHDMHRAVEESRQAAQIRNALGVRLDAVRERLPELVPAAPVGPETEAVQRATSGSALARPGSPLPTPLQPHRPTTPTARPAQPERGSER
ncbi:relaxase/mobilization nuclease domain-containing protein [Leucobacter sp. wl10]|uniref:relaxase/mobilization nuclease domain-containing protein n=1 Tax=Leucobacter sp. wl10 TaxID=2304677 RepID=UPI001F098812|nr:relaxase/mobilization nuclease domain-containing protein [Leucobacter sp. wl10]